ncbi:hypothetical protein AgCh_035922 [Apium graveolens]
MINSNTDNKDNVVHGWISAKTGVGFWVISPSSEYRTGGPFKQELTSHCGPTSLAVFFSNHYSGKKLDLHFGDGEAWKKVYGPVFVYMNSAPNKNVNDLHSTLWTDVKRQASIEQKSYPYSFPLSNDYPHANQRGTVRGRLQVSDRTLTLIVIKGIPALHVIRGQLLTELKTSTSTQSLQWSDLSASTISANLTLCKLNLARSASVNPQIDENALTLEIPNLDAGLNSSTKPIPFRIKVKSMNNGRSIRRVKLLSLGQIPQQNPYLSPLAQNDHQEKQQQY